MEEKICSKCKNKFSLDNFYIDNRRKDKHTSQCKICQRETTKKSIIKRWGNMKQKNVVPKAERIEPRKMSLNDLMDLLEHKIEFP